MAEGSIYDSVFKTLVHHAPKLLVPFANEAFGRSYPLDARVVAFNDEHQGPGGRRVSDSVFGIGKRSYHVECQSTPDGKMAIRMIEYDFAVGIEQALASGPPYEVVLPASCVLFVRHDADTPDALRVKVVSPGGDSLMYEAKVVKAQAYTADEIFEKGLLLLLPFYLMRYERELPAIACDPGRAGLLAAECEKLREGPERATAGSGDLLLYSQVAELIMEVNEHLLKDHDELRRKVASAMGGEILELKRSDRLAREIREAREQGLEEGRKTGMQKGMEQGMQKGLASLSRMLQDRGVDPALLADAVAELRKSEAD